VLVLGFLAGAAIIGICRDECIAYCKLRIKLRGKLQARGEIVKGSGAFAPLPDLTIITL
jgi:hypothetical protein